MNQQQNDQATTPRSTAGDGQTAPSEDRGSAKAKNGSFKAIKEPSVADLLEHAVQKKGKRLLGKSSQFGKLCHLAKNMSEEEWEQVVGAYSDEALGHSLPTLCDIFAFSSRKYRPVLRPLIQRIFDRLLEPTQREKCRLLLQESDHTACLAIVESLLIPPESVAADAPPSSDSANPKTNLKNSPNVDSIIRGLLLLSYKTGNTADYAIDLLSPVLEHLYPPGHTPADRAITAVLKTSSWEAMATCEQSLRQRLTLSEGREGSLKLTNETFRATITARDATITKHLNTISEMEDAADALRARVEELQNASVDQGMLHDADLHSARGKVVRLIRSELPVLEKALTAAEQPTPRMRVVIDHLARVIDSMKKHLPEKNGGVDQ